MRRIAVLACCATFACADLQPIPTNECGNSVIEQGEDCDTFANPNHAARKLGPNEVLSCAPKDDAPRGCAYRCGTKTADMKDTACPDGWVCGRDEVCRVPALLFTAQPAETLDREPDDVIFEDFDGDTFGDLALFDGADVTVRYGGPGGSFSAGVREPVGLIGLSRSFGFGPAVGDIDGNGTADIVAPTEDGVVALLGRRNKTLEPVNYPTGRVTLPSASVQNSSLTQLAIPGEPGPGYIAFVGDGAGRPVLTVGDVQAPLGARGIDPRDTLETDAPIGPHVIAKADLDGNGGDELVVGFPDHGTLLVFTTLPRQRGARGSVRHIESIELGEGNVLAGHLALVDADGAGPLDLVVEVRAVDGKLHLGLLRGQGAGLGTNRPECAPNCHFGTPERFVAPDVLVRDMVGGVLAMGDINGDQIVDFVVAGLRHTIEPVFGPVGTAIVSDRSGADIAYRVASVGRSGWVEAVIGDFNRDGQGDIAATSSVAGGIDVFLGAPSGLFNRGRVETTVTPHLLVTGDFDGDFVTDIAFFEQIEGSINERLSVSFGRLQGLPIPRPMAEIPTPIGAVTVSARGLDAISDLLVTSFVQSPDPELARLDVYPFGGSTDQRLRAALDLSLTHKTAPLGGLLLGHFTEDDDGMTPRGLDLVAVTLPTINEQNQNVPSEAYLVRAEFLAGRTETSTGPKLIRSDACDVRFASLDKLQCSYSTVLTIPERDRLLGPLGAPGDVALRFGCQDVASGGDGNNLLVQLFRPSIHESQRACNQAEVPSFGLDEVSRAEVTRIDKDQKPDLLLVHGTNGLTSSFGASGVSIHWGAHVSGTAYSIDLGEGELSTRITSQDVLVEDAALADLDLDGDNDVVVLSPFGLFRALQLEDHVFEPLQPLVDSVVFGFGYGGVGPVGVSGMREPVSMLPESGRLFVRDIDGDGVADAVVVRGRSILTYKGEPVPRGGFSFSPPVMSIDPEALR